MHPILKVAVLCALVDLVYSKDWTSDIYNGEPAGSFVYNANGTAVNVNNKGEYPYLASMQRTSNGVHNCGACIVKNDVLLTAAHCVDGAAVGDFRIVAGSMMVGNRLGWNPSAQERQIKSIVMHPEYNVSSKFYADIAIITLTEPLEFNKFVDAIKVANFSDWGNFVGEKVRIMGWGLSEKLVSFLNLMYADMQVVDNEPCSKVREFPVVDSMICVHEANGKQGACLGDSGGPMVQMPSNDPKTHLLLGVTSNVQIMPIEVNGRNVSTCLTQAGSIYTDVAAFRPWIDKFVQL